MDHTKNKTYPLFRVIRKTVELCYPKITVEGMEKLPDEPVILVGNHSQLHGPIACELYFPDRFYTWCAGQMMHLKDVPEYAYEDFWSQKPAYVRWFFKLAAYVIAPLSVVIFNNARTIAVYRDNRILNTFRETIARLQDGCNVVIFPEHDVTYNHILYDFQDRFIDIAKLYYRRSGKRVCFVPLYIAPNLKKMYIGDAVRYDPEIPAEEERRRICRTLMDAITDLACALPEHTVVPYRNIPKRDYPSNLPKEAASDAKTDC